MLRLSQGQRQSSSGREQSVFPVCMQLQAQSPVPYEKINQQWHSQSNKKMYYCICELKSDYLESWNMSWEQRWEKLLYQKGQQCLYSRFGFKAPSILLQLLCLPFCTNDLAYYVYFNVALQICVLSLFSILCTYLARFLLYFSDSKCLSYLYIAMKRPPIPRQLIRVFWNLTFQRVSS